MTHDISVTYADLYRGNKNDASSCPVALAVTRVIGKPVKVRSSTVVVDGGTYPLPKSVQELICNFDDGVPVEPIQFSLTIEDKKSFLLDDVNQSEARTTLLRMYGNLSGKTLFWSKTDEGVDYWDEVASKLIKYANRI